MCMNFDQLFDLANVTVVNYQKNDDTIFIKFNLLNETTGCPNCHQILDRVSSVSSISDLSEMTRMTRMTRL